MATIPPPDDVVWVVVDAIVQAVTIREAIADGRFDEADAIVQRLEIDLIGLRVLLEERAA